MTMAPRVLVVALGGTIAMTASTTGGVVPNLTAHDLLDAVPGLAELGVELEALTFRSLPSASLAVPDLLELVALVADHGADGVVVTQGTDTIEETAYALDLLHRGPRPLVVTGAMRNPALAGADGPANLLAAITVAASPAARDLGCVVVFADEVHSARRVRKTHATSVATFASPDGGPLGYVAEGSFRLFNRPPTRHLIPAPARPQPPGGARPPGSPPPPGDSPPSPGNAPSHGSGSMPSGGGSLPVVGLYTATLGDDGALLAAVGDRLDGLVVAGFGVGHVPAGWVEVLGAIAARVPVVLASRAGAGPALTGTYGYPGSERDLIARGLIPAGYLHPYKARLLLQLALAVGAGRAQITAALAVEGRVTAAGRWPWP